MNPCTCNGNGYVLTPDGDAAPCACLQARKAAAQVRATIPEKFRDIQLTGIEPRDERQKAGLRIALDYLGSYKRKLEDGQGLVLYGKRGSGKTMLACALANTLATHGVQSLFLNAPEWFGRIRESFQEGAEESEHDIVTEARNADLLILDDIGVDKCTEFVERTIYLVVNGRMNDVRPIIATTNCETVRDLATVIGERSASRLYEMCQWVPWSSIDYRIQKGQKK